MRRIVAAFVLAASGSASLAAAACPMAWSTAHAAEAAPRHAAASHRHEATPAQKAGAPLSPDHVHGADARHDSPDDAPAGPNRSCAQAMTCGAVAAAPAPPVELAMAEAVAASSPPEPRHATDAPLAHDPPPPRLPV